jgi:protein ImuA
MNSPLTLETLRQRVRMLERPAARHNDILPFGVPAIDLHLPEHGLPRAALHEIGGGGADAGPGACAALFVAGILARMEGAVFWCAERPDVFAPGLACAGLAPDRVLYAEVGDEKTVLLVMEEALRRRAEGKAEDASVTAAATRWCITPLPAAPLETPGMGRARWRVELTRCRGGTPANWILEACDAQGFVHLPATLAGRPSAPAGIRAA